MLDMNVHPVDELVVKALKDLKDHGTENISDANRQYVAADWTAHIISRNINNTLNEVFGPGFFAKMQDAVEKGASKGTAKQSRKTNFLQSKKATALGIGIGVGLVEGIKYIVKIV